MKKWFLSAAVMGAATLGFAQSSVPIHNGVLHFQSNIGAMRFYNADGTIKFHFKGTILLRDYKGDLKVSGDLHKEYDSHGRVAYFGTGDLNFTGHCSSMQWFGQDFSGEWDGRGGFRLYGDYDKDLKTGWYWYGDDPSKKLAWPTQGGDMILPQPGFESNQPHLVKRGG